MPYQKELQAAGEHFMFHGDFYGSMLLEEGNINDTFALKFRKRHIHKYVIQRLNPKVYKNPEAVIHNVEAVCEHLEQAISERGGDPRLEAINIVYTKNLESFYVDDQGYYWRAYRYIDGSTLKNVTPANFKRVGIAYGRFLADLANFPVDALEISIPGLSDCSKRYEQLEKAVAENKANRLDECAELVEKAKSHKAIATILDGKDVPLRVVHNDAKVGNVLFSEHMRLACVLDLDTVMPGHVYDDFGNMIRSGCNKAGKLSENLEDVKIDMDLFKVGALGFLKGIGNTITPEEKDSLVDGVLKTIYIFALSYLTDHLNGDTFYGVKSGDNLVKAKVQFALLEDALSKKEEMESIIASI